MVTETNVAGGRHTSRPPQAVNHMITGLLHSPLHGLLDPGICELRYTGRRTGRTVALPVMYARYGEQFVVVVGDAADKRWWRTFTRPYPVEVCRGHECRAGTGRIVHPDSPAYRPAWDAYTRRQHLDRQPGDLLLLIDFGGRPA
jgi:hypothetical protein